MRQDDRERFERALGPARRAAYPPAEFAEQESFMGAGEILRLARRAGIGPDTSVLDLCCGVAGPGRLVTRETGCRYLGVDASAEAVTIARRRARDAGLDCRFEVGRVPDLPAGRFDVALLLETLLAFPDKDAVLEAVSGRLADGGRFAFTVEEGEPLTAAERAEMPDEDTVWPVPLPRLHEALDRAGFAVTGQDDVSLAHLGTVEALARAYAADGDAIVEHVGRRALEELLAAHRLWSDWLRTGRVRKFAVVARKVGAPHREGGGRVPKGHVTSAVVPR